MSRKTFLLLLVPPAFLLTLFATTSSPEPPSSQNPREFAYLPEQPIPFSHRIHAEVNQIPCEYCHFQARRSPVAGVPPVEWCMNCHKVVRLDSPFIQKVKAHYDERKPIEWVKVFDLPDHVYFTHKVHVRVGEELNQLNGRGFTCQTCHGEIEKMDRVGMKKWDDALNNRPLTMGWCLNCHKSKAEDFAWLYKLKKEGYRRNVPWETLKDEIKPTEEEVRHTLAKMRDCWTCHK